MSVAALAERVAAGTVVVVEALSVDFFASGHVPDSVNLPLSSSDSALAAFIEATSLPIVVYGSGDGGEAVELAERLDAIGDREVFVLRGGKESWVEAGQPLEQGPL